MIWTFVQRVCWAVVAFGLTMFVLLMMNVVQPALWIGIAVILAFPAFIMAGILRTNDFLRTRGSKEAEIPTSRRALSRSIAISFLVGLGFAVFSGLVVYFASQ
jgi:hypothetical protein